MATDSILVNGNTKVDRTDITFAFREFIIQEDNVWKYLGSY